MASFASMVKKELTQLEVHPEHAKAELSALIRMNGSLTLMAHRFVLNIQTENPAIARRIYSLIRQVYRHEANLVVHRKMKLKKNYQYIVRLTEGVNDILSDLSILDPTTMAISTTVPATVLEEPQRMRSYLRGAFLAGGSVNNPETSRYHLEIYSLYADHNAGILKMMNHFNLNARTVERRSGYIVYLKEAEKIADFLQVIGATNAMLKFEDVRIVRDMRNSVNRLVNCETANMNKTIDAAQKQIENINYLKDHVGLDNLPTKLREIAVLRLAHPDVSLQELGAMVPGGTISKSGVNHRLRKLNQIAEGYQQPEDA
ncbi:MULTISPECIES: DNA-binding protein WhiA [Lacticaseibacillus]|jgi:DNA-binding protein WhiA|uniref:Probable cell division protein WhiA n=7 Tax=Lacticaseibacillus TaxID=2759736 RepID=A0AAN1EYE1_LACCA|nr:MULTISPECIES: DNA-binding protein WhiA [Lacticaseibacillus]OFS00084.1 sporulation regulator WhiA [Lactobacillus sp. HMSC068F07]ARY91050.1 DNA-binding protein WhiA [Lacticaseibacillus casei]KAB1969201.1 DNA-binding protein WhiA [Lacticaseibacillus casei]KLI76082.1 sporulation regulator WhiA [Lacticaseibacillus casei]MDE3281947.1 DNA-binding protein WhiA [Lacticaseibacillus casei]